MEVKNVLIRGAEQVDKINPMIIDAMELLKPEDKINIYYTGGLMEEIPKIYDDIDKFVGIATNVHKDDKGNYVCDCIINDYLSASQNFDNVIDNITVTVQYGKEDEPPALAVAQFVIYDLAMKQEFDRMKEEEEAGKEYKEGEVPFPRPDNNPFKDEQIQEAIHNDVKQFMEGAAQQ